MTKGAAAERLRASLRAAINQAKWDGLTEADIAAILAGEAVR